MLHDSVPLFNLWSCLQPRWRHGPMGPTGLDFASVESWMRMARHPLRREPDTAELLLAMERAALAVWREQRDAAALARG